MARSDICRYGKLDCYSYRKNGVCYSLRDTNFKSGVCPFYKDRIKRIKELEELKIREEAQKNGKVI